MFKLAVVGGPAKGKSYMLRDGETSVGRVEGNDLVLQSTKVSKKHCVLVVNNASVTVKDAGSSNGTFVNGVLTKLKAIRPGDRVSVGEYVLELVKIEAPRAKPMPGNVVPIHGGPVGMQASGAMSGGAASATNAALPSNDAPPQDLKEKVIFYFEKYILNFVYNLNEKHEWHVMMAGMLAILTVAAVVVSVYPLVERVSEKLGNEAAGRALVLARQMVDRNAPAVFERQEAKMDISYVEKEPGVTGAYIIDMDQRVMAPGRKLNQSIGDPTEAVFATQATRFFYDHEQHERFVRVYGDIVAVSVPLRVFNSGAGKNVVMAVGLVYFDRSLVLIDSGTEMLSYVQGLILAAIFTVMIFFSLYRLTLRPLVYLNEQIDQVLKGNAQTVEKKFKMEEINPLIDVVNAALQRAAQGGPNSMSSGADDGLELAKFIGSRLEGGGGLMIFDGEKRIQVWTPFIEEMTSIRADGAIGQEVGAVARDAAFGAFVEDLFQRAPFAGSEPIGDMLEFSGTQYQLDILATGSPGAVKSYVIAARRA